MQLSLYLVIIYFFLISQISANQCLKCYYVIKFACVKCQAYCPLQATQIYSSCSYKNCSQSLKPTCQQKQFDNLNNSTIDSNCANYCCPNNQNDVWLEKSNSNQIQRWSNMAMHLGIFCGVALFIILLGCVYRKCKQNNSSISARFNFLARQQNGNQEPNSRSQIQAQNSFFQKSLEYLNPSQQSLKISQDIACAICLEDHTNTITQCRHYFHFKCLKQWHKRSHQCPLCKGLNLQLVATLCFLCKMKFVYINLGAIYKNQEFLGVGVIAGSKCQDCQSLRQFQ